MNDRKAATREVRPAKSGFGLTTGWAAVILALLVVLFFHDVFLGGKTFVSPDTTAPAGFVRVGEHSLWQDHVYPLWNPFVFLGMPSFGSGTYNPLIYPPDWPLALVQKVVPLPDMTWLLLYYFLGGLFFFLLAREWRARPEASLIAAVAFIFAPNLVAVGSHGHGSQLVDSAYLPLLLWLAARWMRRGSLADLGWLALAGGFQILRGHVQICFYTWLAVGLMAGIDLLFSLRNPAELRPRLLRVAGIGGAAALAFGVAGFYSLPLQDYARWSIRGGSTGGGVGMDYATAWSLATNELPTIVIPGWAGFGGETYWGGMPFTDYPNAFLGIVAVLLAVPAFLRPGAVPRAVRVFAGALAALSLFIAFGKNSPLYGFLYAHLPLFNKFRVPVMVLLLFQLAAALALAWGWSVILDSAGDRPARPAKSSGNPMPLSLFFKIAGALLLAGLLVALSHVFREGYTRMAVSSHPNYSPDLAAAAYGFFAGDLARACLLGLAALAVAWFAKRRRLGPVVASAAVLALVLIELLPVSGRVMAPVIGERVAAHSDAGRDDVVRFLEAAGPVGSFRALPLAEMTSNRFTGYSIATLGGYHAAKPRLYQDLVDAGLQSNLGWLRLLNVRFIVTPQPLEPAPPYMREVFRGSQIVYENLLALPRAMMVDRFRVVSPPAAILDSVSRGTSESAEVAFLAEDPGIPQGTMGKADARIVSYRLNDVTIETESEGPALLRLADLWYPDWVAKVDGRDQRILRTDYFLRGIVVPAGRHRVVLTFQSKAMRQGLTLSIVCFAVALGAIAVGSWRRRRPGAPAGAA